MGTTKERRKLNQHEPKESAASTVDADLASEALCALNQILDEPGSPINVGIAIDGHSNIVQLPRGIGEILRQILVSAAAGQPVAIVPAHAELTTQQAADRLNVSRPYVIKLVDDGTLECRKVGTHRRIQAASVRDYQRQMELDSKTAADELTNLTEELELY